MKKHLHKIKPFVVSHKIISIIIFLVILLIGYWGYGKITSTAGDIRYLATKVVKGAIVVSVSGSGQVSAFNQVDVKAKASGDVIYIAAQDGQKIRMGALIAQLDAKDAQKSVRDAEISLESSQISLDKLKIQNSRENMDADLAKSYDDGFNTVSSVFLDLPGIMTGLNDMFFKIYTGTSQWTVDWYGGLVGVGDQYKASALKENFTDSYNKAKDSYNTNLENYKIVSRTSDNATIEALITQTYKTTKLISDAVKNANNYIDFVNGSIQENNFTAPAIITTNKTTLSAYTSKTNTHLTNLLAATTTIKNYKDAFPNSDLDIQSATLSVKQKTNAWQDAKDKLADYFIRAPFDGTIAKVNIKKSDSVNTGTVAATLITKTQIAEISMNEVDVAKIKIGQKATLTFDAVPDLTISGVVADIDAVGTVSQGVVTYNIKINFDTQDDRVKSAMSVSAAIITDTKQNVLTVPNSAVKSQAGTNYVEMFDRPESISNIPPRKQAVEVGLSNDSRTEIVSGLKEGDEVVSRTILPTSVKTTAAPSIFGSPATGNRGNTGGAGRVQAR
jgi:HlyD family secretion protein